MEKFSLLSFIIQFCPVCKCHIRRTKLANLHFSSSCSWNWGFPWDNGEEILGVLHAIIDAPAGSVRLPWSMDCRCVLPCSSVSCHPASLELRLLFENMNMYKTVPCLVQLEWWTKQKIAYEYTAQNIFALSVQVAFYFTMVGLLCCISGAYLFHTKVSVFFLMRKAEITRILFP